MIARYVGNMRKNKRFMMYGLLTVVSAYIIAMSCLHLWGTDMNVPIAGYRSDSIGVLLEANNYIRGGDAHHIVCYRAPEINGYANIIGDSSVPIPLIGILARIFGSVEAGVNIHGIMNYILLALSMYWVGCKININEGVAMVIGLSYSCLSYFVMYCNTLLLIYSYCFYIPLCCFIIIHLMLPKHDDGEDKIYTFFDIMFIIGVMLFAGLNSAYYAFFLIIILTFVGLYSLLYLKSVDKVLLVIASYIALGIGIAVYIMPNILYSINSQCYELIWKSRYYYCIWCIIGVVLIALGVGFYKRIYPRITIRTLWYIIGCMTALMIIVYFILKKYTNFIGAYEGRTPYLVELGAMNIVNTVLPAINNIFEPINQDLPLLIDFENQDVTAYGILAGMGFCYSIMNIWKFNDNSSRKDEILQICGLCNCFMVVLSVKGGFASIVATYVTAGIRCYARIYVFMAVFSLLAFGILLDKIFEKIKTISVSWIKWGALLSTVTVVLVGFLLSCPTDFIVGDSFGLAEYEQRKQEYDDWKQLINEIESVMPENGMVYELPADIEDNYFGELMKAGRAYELSIPVILSKTTTWSYGSDWSASVGIEETEVFINNISEAGFKGIYIDTLLYADDSYVQHIEMLRRYFGEPIVCNQNRRYFFDISM